MHANKQLVNGEYVVPNLKWYQTLTYLNDLTQMYMYMNEYFIPIPYGIIWHQ